MALRGVAMVLLLTMSGLLAGCSDAPAPDDAAAEALPELSSYADCPWTDPAGAPYDCDARGIVLETHPAAPEAWQCMEQRHDEGWILYWDPASGQRGIQMRVPAEVLETLADEGVADLDATPDVVLHVQHQDVEHVFQLPAAGIDAFVVLPLEFAQAMPDPTSPTLLDADPIRFRYLVYDLTTIATGNLSGQAEQRWSLWERQLMLATAFTVDGTSHTFADNHVFHNTRRTEDGDVNLTFVEPQTYFLDGADFTYAQIYTLWHVGRSLGARDTTGLDRACTLDAATG